MPTISSAEVVTSLNGATVEAVVTWHTDELCDATGIWFWAGVAQGRLDDPELKKDHSLTINGLDPGTDDSVPLASSADRGSFSSNPAATGPNGSVQVSYTPVKRGKSQIQVLVDTVSTGVDVMAN